MAYFIEFTSQFMLPPGVPLYASITITGALSMGIEIGVDWVSSDSGVQTPKFNFHDFTIAFSLGFELTVGLGIKGVVSIWVKGSASINFTLNVYRDRPVDFIIGAEASLSAGITLLVVTISGEFLKGTWQLYPDQKGYSLLDTYMARALPDDDDDPDAGKAVSTGAEHYPDLAPEAELKLSGLNDTQSPIKCVELDGDLYVFLIQDGRVHWHNVNKNIEGDIADAIAAGQKQCDSSGDIASMKDYAFDVCAASGTAEVPYHALNCDDFLVVAGVCAAEFDDDGYPLDKKDNAWAYAICLWPSPSDGRLICGTNGHDDYLGFFRCAAMGSDGGAVSFVGGDPRIHMARFAMDTFQRPDGLGCLRWDNAVDVELSELNKQNSENRLGVDTLQMNLKATCLYGTADDPYAPRMQYLDVSDRGNVVRSDDDVASGAGGDYERVFGMSDPDGSWIAASRSDKGAGDAGAIEFYDPAMDAAGAGKKKSVVLDTGDIRFFAQKELTYDDGTTARLLFYTDNAGSEAKGNRYQLKSLYVQTTDRNDQSGDLKVNTTHTSYDITLPSYRFGLVTIRSAVYLYWLSSGSKSEDGKADTYRVYTAFFDPTSNTMSDAQVLAEFNLPDDNLAIHDLFITDSGNGFFTAAELPDDIDNPKASTQNMPLSVYAFAPKLSPVLNLQGQLVEDLLVSPGDFDDVTVTVMNTGNMAATTLTVNVVLETDGGDSEVATLYADCLKPENSSLVMNGQTLTSGEKAFYRAENYDYTPAQKDWVLEEKKTTYTVEGGVLKSTDSGDAKDDYIKTKMIMPGALAAFKGSFQIPSDWRGEKKVDLRIGSFTSDLNWVGAMSAAAGRSSISEVKKGVSEAGNTRLTWTRDKDTGEMVLENPELQSQHAWRIPERMDAPNAVSLSTLHDLTVDDRLYTNAQGEYMLDIAVLDLAHTGESIRLSTEVYVDDAEKPVLVNMSHYPDAVSDHATHTFTLPLSALVDPATARKVRVVVRGVDIKEAALANNEFTLYLNGLADPLTILRQPRDLTIQEGESASFDVLVAGGVWPYSYQWQIWDAKHGKWVDIPGATERVLSRENVEKKWNGARFRCVITDRAGTTVISEAATLTVRDGVDTGDHSNLPLYLAVAAIALALLWWVRRRSKRA